MIFLNNIVKRVFDILISGILIILLFPILIIVAILIKIDSEGPVFFKQNRRTINGKVFGMMKFRSMCLNAENMGAGLFNYKDDPRVTKIGRVLRDTSIDELPQLFNIFIGDMSFVGPRPCVEYELGDFDTLNKRFKKRFEVKAGLTGLAQVKGRNDISWDDKVNYDNEYIDLFKSQGIFIDLLILAETFIKVFKRDNIYENKLDENLDDAEAARIAEEEIIRRAHIEEGE